jgi:hypothetical protein
MASLHQPNKGGGSKSNNKAWEEPQSDEDEEEDLDMGAVELFLAAAGLPQYIPEFIREKIDLEVELKKKTLKKYLLFIYFFFLVQALMLLTEEDLKSMGMEMGPRRKLLKAIRDREAALEDPGQVVDSRL